MKNDCKIKSSEGTNYSLSNTTTSSIDLCPLSPHICPSRSLTIAPVHSTSQHTDSTRDAAHAAANLTSHELTNQPAAAKHTVSAAELCFTFPSAGAKLCLSLLMICVNSYTFNPLPTFPTWLKLAKSFERINSR